MLTLAPHELLANARAELEATAQRLAARSAELANSGSRAAVVARIAAAYAQNATFFARLAAETGAPASAATGSGYVADVVEYLRVAGTPDGADDEARIAAAVTARIPSDRGLAVVLGAGLATHARTIAPAFDRVIAVELSPTMTLAALAAEAGPVALCEINERNTWHIGDVVHDHEVALPPLPVNVSRCVADALRLPLADGSVNALVSVFFTDVVSLAPLVAEARRVLRRGGVFVHVGTLGWHFYRPAEMWSAEEVRQLFADGGVPIVEEGTIEVTILGSPRRMANVVANVWTFTARRS